MISQIADLIDLLTDMVRDQGLIQLANDGCEKWFGEHLVVAPCDFSELQLELRSQSLTFWTAYLSKPHITTSLTLRVHGQEVGSYRLVTLLDGTVTDDSMVIHPPEEPAVS